MAVQAQHINNFDPLQYRSHFKYITLLFVHSNDTDL